MLNRAVLSATALLIASPALAHPGDHMGMSLIAVVQHYARPDHLALLALSVIVGVVAYRWGRKFDARARVKAKIRNGGKS